MTPLDSPAPNPPGRATSGPRRGLVLGAGGVLGASWTIAALQALVEATGWDPRTGDVVMGTSAGSVLAAFIGSGVGVDAMVNHQLGIVVEGDPRIEFDSDKDSGGALPPRPKLRLGSAGLLRNAMLHPGRITPTAALASVLPEGRGSLEPLARMIGAVAGPLWPSQPRTWIVTMDYDTGKRVPFGRSGAPMARLPQAVKASCAIPGWYAPVVIGGRRYVDGGVCSSTSLDLVTPLGLDEVFVLAPMVSFTMDSPATMAGRLERRMRRAVTKRLEREADKVRANGTKVVMIGPGSEDLEAIGANLMDPSRRQRVFDTSLRTSAVSLHRALGSQPAPGFAAAG